jgi:hypothetical protein
MLFVLSALHASRISMDARHKNEPAHSMAQASFS